MDRFLLALIAAIEQRAVNPELATAGVTAEEKEMNAKYAISCARTLGCTVFCLWEDIVEVNQKMMVVLIASLMALSTTTRHQSERVVPPPPPPHQSECVVPPPPPPHQ